MILKPCKTGFIPFRYIYNSSISGLQISVWQSLIFLDSIEEEKAKDKRNYFREYKIKNRDQINEKKRVYRLLNKETLNKKQREYYLENKEKVNEKDLKYSNQNKDKINERYRENYIKKNKEINEQYEPRERNKKWKDRVSTRLYFDSLTNLFQISHYSDWYRISAYQIRKCGG
jgi:hypothetical protein